MPTPPPDNAALPMRVTLHKKCDVCPNSCLHTFPDCDFAEVPPLFPLSCSCALTHVFNAEQCFECGYLTALDERVDKQSSQ
jgi:hypothetical protein